ncbi:MAG TPA: thiamine diphosphokinase, partial [Chthonomonadaceae bacterium]|nr:thiamine diphosphokinase [Chthonomonadaceae bacterium]
MRVLILADGDPPRAGLAQEMAAAHELVLATDGAAHRAALLGITPDIICGDFDSLRREEAEARFPQAAFLPMHDQDRADLEKAIRWALERGAEEITLLGATGGRLDHTLANCALLLRYGAQAALRIVDDRSETWALSGEEEAPAERRLTARPGATLSLISFDGKARVTLQGTRWPLEEAALPMGTQGVSNVVETDPVFIRVHGGSLLVCLLHP